MRSSKTALALITTSFIALAGTPSCAEIAVSANDGKMVMDNGVAKVRKEPLPDTVSIIDLSGSPPRILAEMPVPASVVGPPPSVAIAPDESFALVTGAMKVDPTDPTKAIADDKLTVIDLNPRRRKFWRRCRPAPAPPGFRSIAQARWRWWPTATREPSPSSRSAATR